MVKTALIKIGTGRAEPYKIGDWKCGPEVPNYASINTNVATYTYIYKT